MKDAVRFSLVAAVLLCAAPSRGEGPAAAVRAPEFSAQLVSGETVSLRKYAGRAVLLSFFASWCGPCREEAPLLNELAGAFPSTLQVLAGGFQESDPKALAAAGAEFGLRVPLVVDARGTIAVGYKVTGLPTSVLVDEFGFIVKQYRGITKESAAELKALIETRSKAIAERRRRGLAVFVSNFADSDERSKAGHTGATVADTIRTALEQQAVKLVQKPEEASLLVSGSVSDLGAVVGAEIVVSEPAERRELSRVRGSIVGGNAGPLVKNTIRAVKDWAP